MNQIFYLFTVALLALGPLAQAQLFPYNFTVSSESYADLQGATLLTNDTWDDPEYVVPIGFDFEFLGSSTNTIAFIGLGGTISFGGDFYTEPIDLLYAYGSDIIDRGFNNNQMLSPISYKLEGNPGSRVFKLEWKNAGFYEELINGASTNFVNFQLWLYEGSNNLEIRFGPNNVILDDIVHDINGDPFLAFVDDLDYNGYTSTGFWALAGDQNNPTVEAISFDDYDLAGLDDDPADGTVYRFEFDLTSVRENNSLQEVVTISPTLVQDELFVTLADASLRNGTIQVINQLGQVISSQPLQYGFQSVDVANLATGQYFVSVRSEQAIYTEKILKR